MKKHILSIQQPTFLASLTASLTAAGMVLCGNLTQAQPTISSLSLPNAPNGGQNGYPIGAYQFQGAAPSADVLSFQVNSLSGVTGLAVQLTATTLPGVVTTTTLTPASGLSVSGQNTSESVNAPLAGDMVYSVVISATDSGGTTSSTKTFDTINPNYYTFEAEDFDYGGGQFYDNPQIDSYSGQTATIGIDCNNHSGGLDLYRPNPLETESTSDTPRLEYALTTDPDYDVGYNNGGDWGNYTRNYPAGLYNIYLRGSGGNGPQANACGIGFVTSGNDSTNQAANVLGDFSVAGLGWQTFTWCPAFASGNLAAFGLGGDQETLRFSVLSGNCNENFYLLVPAAPIITPNNTTVYQGSPVTLSIDPFALSTITAIQWQTDNGSGGASWADASGASTGTNYAVPTNLMVEPYEYQVLVTISADSSPVTVTSAVVTLNIQPPSAPIVVTSPVSVTETLNANSTINPAAVIFSAAFTGSPTITYKWLSAPVSGTGVVGTFTAISGQTSTTLTVNPTYAVQTNEYELQAVNGLGTNYTSPATLTVGPVGPIQIAGDLIAEIRSSDLVTGGVETTWTNRSGSGNSVGNFMTGSSGPLTVSNHTVNAGLPLWAGNSVNALYVGDRSANALFSAGLTPAEINGNGPVSMEAWVYCTSVVNQQNQLSYGLGGGSGAPAEEREFGYGTAGYAAFTADYGNSDSGWSTVPTVGWHYLAVTYDGTTVRLYQDGVANGTAGSPMSTVQTRLEVGQGDNATDTGGANDFLGYIAAARVMSGVLTAGQVANNFNSGLLGEVPITVDGPTATPSAVTQGNSFTLADASTVNYAGLSFTYQWYTDNGSGGASFTSISGATSTTLLVSTASLSPGTYEYELVYTSTMDGIVTTSSPVSVLVGAAIAPALVTDINPSTINTYVTVTNSFSASFTGAPPLYYMWQVSANGSTWVNTGNTTTNITVESEVPETEYYRLAVSNSIGTNVSSVGTLVVAPALALPAFLPLQTAGDIIVDLENAGLSASYSAWSNRSIAAVSVGNFSGAPTNSVPTLNVSTAAAYLYNRINTLYVNENISNALQSALLAPAEIIGNNPVSAEAWIYATGVNEQNSCAIAYGDQGNNAPAQADREFNYCTAGGGATSGDFGNYDMQWTTTPAPGAWHYLAWTYDGTTVSAYLDGALNNSKVPGAPNVTPATLVCVGGAIGPSATGNPNLQVDFFQGFIGAARLESGVLTPAQIANNFTAGLLGIIPISLGVPSVSPFYTASGVSNVIEQGQTATLGVVFEVTNALYPTTYQWYTDGGSDGANWTAINNATNTTYVYDTTTAGAYEFEVLATNVASSVGTISQPTTVNVVAGTAPTIVQDTTPAGITTIYVTQTASFSATFSGAVPLFLQWQQSPNGAGSWSSVGGATGTNLTLAPEVAGTNYYRLQASNSISTAYSTAAELVVLPAPPLPPPGTIQVAGDLIVNLQVEDLTPGISVWKNQTTSASSVGNFTALGGGNLNLLALDFNYSSVNTLNVEAIANNAVASVGLSPSEINAGNPVSMEVWVNATGFGSQDTPLSYGVGGGAGAPSEERSLGYGTAGYGGFTADYGSADCGWTTPPTVGWHYLVATYDGNSVIIYQDGVANGGSTPGSLVTVQSYINVGSANGGIAPVGGASQFDGSIGAVRVESGVLTSAQIQSNYTAGVFGTVPASFLPPPSPPTLEITYNNGVVTLTWSAGILLQSTSVNGPYTPVPGATSPYPVTPGPGAPVKFYEAEIPNP